MESGQAREIEGRIHEIFNGSQGANENGNLVNMPGIHELAAQYPDNFEGQRDYLMGLAYRYENIRDIVNEEIARLRAGVGEENNMYGGKKRRSTKKKHARKNRKT